MSARVVFEGSKARKREDIVGGDGDTFAAPHLDDYVLEDQEVLVSDDETIGIPYVQPALFPEADEIVAEDGGFDPVDNLLGPLPEETHKPIEEDLQPVDASIALSTANGEGNEVFNVSKVLVSESFRLPGSNFILTKGDSITFVEANDKTFVSRSALLREAEDPDALLTSLAYDQPNLEAQEDGVLDGVVLDETTGKAYCEAVTNFSVPGITPKLVVEKGDRFVVHYKTFVEAEADGLDDSTKGDEADAFKDKSKAGDIASDDRAAADALTKGTKGFGQASGPTKENVNGKSKQEAEDEDEDEKDDKKTEGKLPAFLKKKEGDDEDEDEKDKKKSEGEVPPQFLKKGDKKDDDEGDDKKKDDKKDEKKKSEGVVREDQGLIGRKSARRLKFTLRQSADFSGNPGHV